MALSTSPPRAKMQLTKRGLQQFSLWPLRSAPGSLGTYGFLTPPYGLPYGLELKNNPRLCTSLRVYASNTPPREEQWTERQKSRSKKVVVGRTRWDVGSTNMTVRVKI